MEKKHLSESHGSSKMNESQGSLKKTIIKNENKIIVTLVSLLFIMFLLNSLLTIDSTYLLNKKFEEISVLNEPVNLGLAVITCEGCSDVSSIVESIKSGNVNILKETSFDSNSNDAKDLILKYNIQKLPSVIITGEVNSDKMALTNFDKVSDALVLNQINAPFLNVSSKEIKGNVELIEIVDSSCDDCINLDKIPISFGEAGVSISNWKKVEYDSQEGKELISKFGIKKVPAMLISNDIIYYDKIKQSLDQLGLNEKQGFYAMHAVQPPYRDLSEKKIVGFVDLIMFNDSSCPNCYDVNVNKKILQSLGIVVKTEKTYDVSSSKGKELISKYNIQKVPAIILSPEASRYDSFVNAWKPVGNVEDDGWFIMRTPEALGTVKDLVRNIVIEKKNG